MDKWNQMALVSLVNCTVYFCEFWALRNFYNILNGKLELWAYTSPSIGKLTDKPEHIRKLLHLLFRN